MLYFQFDDSAQRPDFDESIGLPKLQPQLLKEVQCQNLLSALTSEQLVNGSDNVDKGKSSMMTYQQGGVLLKMAEDDTAVRVENMFREAALEGAGIAMDEFTDDGLLNRKRFRESITLAAFSAQDSSLIGGVVFGTSRIALTAERVNLGLYIVVQPALRRLGYGSAIYQLCEKMGRDRGFQYVLIDVFTHDLAGLALASSQNIFPTGHVPHAGWIKGRGYMPSIILHKVL